MTQFEEYYKKRYDRANVRQTGAVTLSFDSTSISTYSTTITDAAWGHAKQNPELRQVNYMVVCDHASGDVVYAYAYDGSINNKAILPTIYLQMQSATLSLKDNILVTDARHSEYLQHPESYQSETEIHPVSESQRRCRKSTASSKRKSA